VKSVFFCPVYNEICEFPRVLRDLKRIDLPCDEILLINNGSNDGSERLVRESGYPYIDVPKNLGVGYSMMLAIDWAKKHNFDVLGGIASNGKMLPSQMHRLIDPIKQGRADYVKGSRYMDGGEFPNMPRFRRKAIPLVNLFVYMLTGIKTTDSTCGYRAYKIEIFDQALFDWRSKDLYTYGFEYFIDSKVMRDSALRYLEVPVSMMYPKKGPYTKMTGVRSWIEMLRPWVKAWLDPNGFKNPSKNLKRFERLRESRVRF